MKVIIPGDFAESSSLIPSGMGEIKHRTLKQKLSYFKPLNGK
jgi:hypothetical protein